MNSKSKERRLITGLMILMVISLLYLVFHRPNNVNAYARIIAQSYGANSSIQPGMIVQLSGSHGDKVAPLDIKNIEKMFGVVISASETPLTLSQAANTQQVFVTNTGQHNVLVSSQGGPIKTGDYITISDLNGIGMKADGTKALILGQAAGNFNGVNNIIGSSVLNNTSGKSQIVNLGSIPVDINIANNPLIQKVSSLPSFLGTITKSITSKPVSALRVYLSLAIVAAGVILSVTVIYASIKNGIISIGRNPLAKKVLKSNLFGLLTATILIFCISLGVAYLVLL